MADSLAGVVLAAGAGTRLRPLTRLRPKALCPVANVPLVDLALMRASAATRSLAVNVHDGRGAMERHLAGRVHLSIEDELLGTAGALGRLRDWIGGRDVLVVNADACIKADLAAFAGGWDGSRIRLLVVADADRPDFGGTWRYAGAAIMPWSDVRELKAEPSGLYERSWARAEVDDRLDLAAHTGPFLDCGTPASYLAANLAESGGAAVIGPGALVEGEVIRSVVWPGATVRPHERLVDCIRAHELLTVSVR